MARAIYLQALADYTRMRRVVPWLVLAAFSAVVVFTWASFNPGSAPVDRYSLVVFMLVFRIVGFSAVFFATANVTAEIEQRTIVYVLTRPVPRWMLLVVRYLAAVTVVVTIGILAALAVSAAAYHGNVFANPLLGRDLLTIGIGGFAYTGVSALLSVITPSRATIIGLLYLFGWEFLVPNMPGTMYYLSVFSHLQAIAKHPIDPGANPIMNFLGSVMGTNTLTTGQSVAALAALTVVAIAIAAWWFTHFEFLPREDTE